MKTSLIQRLNVMIISRKCMFLIMSLWGICINLHAQAVGAGEKIKVNAKMMYLYDANGLEIIHQLFVKVEATHDLDSVEVWFVDLPSHSKIKRLLERANPPTKKFVVVEKLEPPYEYNQQTSTGVGCKWDFWFTALDGKKFSGQNTAAPFDPGTFLKLFDIEELNELSRAVGSTDTLTAADTANYKMAVHMDSVEIAIPIDSTSDSVVCYLDNDGDGSGNPDSLKVFQGTNSCPVGYVDNDQDCDDGDASINNAALEVCDGIDNNCDGMIDVGCMRKGIFSPQDPIIVGESPNPFEDRVTINYSILENNTKIEMQVFDVAGRLVTDLVKETQSSGDYRIEWTPESKVPFGIYHLKVSITSSTAEVEIISRKLMYNR